MQYLSGGPSPITQSGFKIVTEPTEEPVTVADAQDYLRIERDQDENLIAALITVARLSCEAFTSRAFVTQTWDFWQDRFPMTRRSGLDPWWSGSQMGSIADLYATSRWFEIPRYSPVQSITSITTYNDADVSAILSASAYRLDEVSLRARVQLKDGQTWPSDLRGVKAIQTRFVAGYGGASAVPAPIKQAILAAVAHLYENRGCDPASLEMNAQSAALLTPYRIEFL